MRRLWSCIIDDHVISSDPQLYWRYNSYLITTNIIILDSNCSITGELLVFSLGWTPSWNIIPTIIKVISVDVLMSILISNRRWLYGHGATCWLSQRLLLERYASRCSMMIHGLVVQVSRSFKVLHTYWKPHKSNSILFWLAIFSSHLCTQGIYMT